MALVNAYDAKQTSGGNTLLDLVGANNGTFGGATLPVINSNGYIKFTGGHHNTGGDWGRVVFEVDSFLHNMNDNFSILLNCKSTKLDNSLHFLFMMYDTDAAGAYLGFGLLDTERIRCYIRSLTLNFFGDSAISPTKFSNYITTNSQSNRSAVHNTTLLAVNTTNNSAACYTVSSTPVLGAAKAGLSYKYDATMEFSTLLHFNHKLTNSEISNYNCQLQGCI